MPDMIHINTIFKSACALNQSDITIPQALILIACMTRQPTMTEISRLVRCRTAAVTGQIDVLEKRQLVERARQGDDRRATFVQITVKGVEVVAQMHATFETL